MFIKKENDTAKVPVDVMEIKKEANHIQSNDNSEIECNGTKEENDSDPTNTCGLDFNKAYFSDYNIFSADSLNLLSDDLLSLFGSSEHSDFSIILKAGESLPCHQFMLLARCPNVLSNILRSDSSNSLDFTQYSSVATRAFFKYIYTGKLDFVYSLPSEDKSDLFVLAKKYKIEFLEEFLLKSFSADSFQLYSQSTCSPPASPTGGSPDSSQPPKANSLNKSSELHSLAQESFKKDTEDFSIKRENKGAVLSFANLDETLKNQASTSSFNTSKNSSNADESHYDIFKDEIKSPCNSSLLSQGKSKRKLDYSHIPKETKKVCSNNIPTKQENSPEIVMIDSDSDEECLIPKNNSQNIPEAQNNFLDDNEQSMNEDLFKSLRGTSDLNVSGCLGKSEEEVYIEPIVMSPLNSTSFSNLLSPSSAPNKNSSIDKYFDGSFPGYIDVVDNFSRPIFSNKPLSTPPVNKNHLKKTTTPMTPLQEIIIGEATPKPDYKDMITPELKAELRKYGIKPDLDKKKARSLIDYIYDQIHPVNNKLPKDPFPSTSKANTPRAVIPVGDYGQSDSSNDQWEYSGNAFTYEESLFNESKVKNECATNEMNGGKIDLKKTIGDFLKSNVELFRSVVLFRPLLLNKFYKTVKEHGIKCTLHELMDVLDYMCVNYHIEKKDNNRQKRRRRKKATVKRKKISKKLLDKT